VSVRAVLEPVDRALSRGTSTPLFLDPVSLPDSHTLKGPIILFQEVPRAVMAVLYQSQTLPINPPGVEPVLTVPQFWEVMILKCRKPELFVKAMSASEVLEDTEQFIKRTVTFKEVY